MVVVDKGKKLKLVDSDQEDDSDHIDSELILNIENLQELQEELEQVNEEASDAVLEVEKEYNEIRKPVYDRRNEIIKTIPDFWLTAFLSHPALCDFLTEQDQKVFKYLDSLNVEDLKDAKMGYSITFNFKENPYFEETKLAKTFTFFDEGSTKITGTAIKWKKGKGGANRVNHELKGNKRPVTEDSFVSWISESQQKALVEFTDEIAEIIREDLWPNPLKYFNNDADEDSEGDENAEPENDDVDELDNEDSNEDDA